MTTPNPNTLGVLLNTTTIQVEPQPIDPPLRTCNYFIVKNQSVVFDFNNHYGGIPQNLVFNLIGWSILMILFAILRRAAGNYGRWALVRKDTESSETKWTQLFYAPDDVSVEEDSEHTDQNRIGHMQPVVDESSIDYSAEEALEDRRICGWIRSIFTLSDEQYLRKCGVDAVQYLKFQRHLIFLVAIITIACICIILPINFQGTLQGTDVDFGHTTISNLSGTDNRLWVHVVLVILFLPMGIIIMRHFSVNLGIRGSEEDENDVSTRTLMISGVPDTYCTKEFMHRHVTEAYNDETIVEEVQVAYDVSKLSWLDQKRENSRRARMYCESHAVKHGSGQQMKPCTCGIICNGCNCSSCANETDALTFYKKEESDYVSEVEREKARVKTKSIGIAFVTFRTLSDAKKMLDDHKSKCRCFSEPPPSTLSNLLEPWHWSVRMAPPPEDIYWENLNESHRFFFLKTFFINFIVFIFLFFFTSPAYIISQLELILNLKTLSPKLPEKINDFLPTLLLWTLTALLPIIVAYSDWWMGHWRRSVENLWIMRKVFFYLLCMVLILPSVGMTSLRGFFQMFIDSAQANHTIPNNSTLKWNCIFLPDNGAFFVNYVITSALVGTALEYMRFSELFMYAMRLSFARSVAEIPSVRAANLYEFPFGFNYGWMLLIFALTVAYGVVCPLITPFGLFYLVMKHGVDRYNLYYAYKRSKINKNIHATAVNMVIVSLLIQQVILLFFNLIRGRSDHDGSMLSERAIFSITMLSIFVLLFLAQVFFHIFKGISPIQYTLHSSGSQYQPQIDQGGHHGPPSELHPASEDNQTRQFVGFCNPEDLDNVISQQQAAAPSTSTNGGPSSRPTRKRGRKQFLPDVLKEHDNNVDTLFRRPIVTADSATFAHITSTPSSGEPVTQEPEARNSPLPAAYGSTEMTLTTQLS